MGKNTATVDETRKPKTETALPGDVMGLFDGIVKPAPLPEDLDRHLRAFLPRYLQWARVRSAIEEQLSRDLSVLIRKNKRRCGWASWRFSRSGRAAWRATLRPWAGLSVDGPPISIGIRLVRGELHSRGQRFMGSWLIARGTSAHGRVVEHVLRHEHWGRLAEVLACFM